MPWHIGDYTVKITDTSGTVTSNAGTLNLNGVNNRIWRGLVAYYPFNGSANDQTAFNNNGTAYLSSATADRNNKSDSAWAFIGDTASLVDIPNKPQHNFGSQMTVSLWVKFNQEWNYHVESLIWNFPAAFQP
jgi:hypothetical protein